MDSRDYVGFYLNGEFTKVSSSDVYLTLADYLRKIRNLTGTKVVCAEGDCGACTVLIARIQDTISNNNNSLIYKSANSCIQFLGLLDGAHIVTVEGIKGSDQHSLHPVQKNMVQCHGAQCGYCTPGFICSIASLVEDVAREDQFIETSRVKNHLTGNLCRCTGYGPIIESVLSLDLKSVPLLKMQYPNEQEMIKTLKRLIEVAVHIKFDDADLDGCSITREFFLPSSLDDALLFKSMNPGVRIVSGATDLGVLSNKGKIRINQKMSLNNVLSMYQRLDLSNQIYLGSKVSITDAENYLKTNFEEFSNLLHIFASPQIKNQATLVGNLVNASPIGDTIPFMNVSDASVELSHMKDGVINKRKIKLTDFIIGYKKLEMRDDEIVSGVFIPTTESKFKLYKASLRRDLDISQVTFAARYCMTKNQKTNVVSVTDLEIAIGGMSEKVQRVDQIVDILKNDFSQQGVENAKMVVENLFSPFSDVRASRDYRLSLAKNFLQKFFDEVSDSFVEYRESSANEASQVRV